MTTVTRAICDLCDVEKAAPAVDRVVWRLNSEGTERSFDLCDEHRVVFIDSEAERPPTHTCPQCGESFRRAAALGSHVSYKHKNGHSQAELGRAPSASSPLLAER